MATSLPTPLGPSGVPVAIDAENIPGDWLIDADGQCVISEGDAVQATGLASIAQEARIVLLSILGEWFLDEEDGIDWYGSILVKNPNLVAVRAILITALASVVGIRDVVTFDMTLDPATRKASIDWIANTDFGELAQRTEQA